MQDYQRDFLTYSLDIGVLKFGSFVLKSGRTSPYFFNTGLFDSGSKLNTLAGAYARAIKESGIEFDFLYGPAYKGIPLVATVACRLDQDYGLDLPYCFNRKEAKDHGEGGTIVGAQPHGRVLIIDDVISAGTSVRESVDVITAAGATPAGVAISLDRQERGVGDRSAIAEVREDLGLAVVSIVSLEQIIAYLADGTTGSDVAPSIRPAIEAYRKEFGA